MKNITMRGRTGFLKVVLLCSMSLFSFHAADAQTSLLADGDTVTPTATPGAIFTALNPHLQNYANYTAGQAVSTAVSPDGTTLLILTSGYNLLEDASGNNIPAASNEYVFVYNIANHTPVFSQALQVPDTYVGLTFSPDGTHFYVSGGVNDDVHTYAKSGGTWAESGAPIKLGHTAPTNLGALDAFFSGGVGFVAPPAVAGLATTADGIKLIAANFYNDSVSIINLATNAINEVQLRPGLINPANQGVPGGEYPYGVAVMGNSAAYISSVRDREIDVVSLTGTPALTTRIPVPGNPTKIILNKAGTRLYVATDNADTVEVIDTRTNTVIQSIATIAPSGAVGRGEGYRSIRQSTVEQDEAYRGDRPDKIGRGEAYRGVDPNSLALSPDEKTLYVTNGGMNDIAVISLAAQNPHVTGLIPAGDLPNAVSISADGKWFYAVNGRSTPGPNPGNCSTNSFSAVEYAKCAAANSYILQLSKAGFLAAPVPGPEVLDSDTMTALSNDNLLKNHPNPQAQETMAFLHDHIKHVIYIVRENRTYDQILGDLGKGNSDPALAEFGKTDAPNAHNLALNFVDLDNFYDVGEVSGNGWPWSTTAHESDMGAKNLSVNYAGRGLTYDWEGTNRNVNVGQATLAEREAANPLLKSLASVFDLADVLPGTGNIAAPDSPTGIPQQGYLWDSAFRANLSVRNYGFLLDLARYTVPVSFGGLPELTNPASTGTQVAYSANPTLAPVTDPYFRGFDTAFPDYYREVEWQREFNNYVTNNNLPNLELVRLMHDHLGSFSTAIAGVNTPDIQVADNDYAVGSLISAVAHSPYANNTLIFVIEDDAQDGPDHVDAHRSEAFIVGPYVKQGAIVHTHYSTVNFLATVEDILGIDHLSVHDAYQQPMYDVFDIHQRNWTYNATVPAPLSKTTLPVAAQAENIGTWRQLHPASYWAAMTRGYDWSKEDDVPTNKFNIVLWKGLEPGKPYPLKRNSTDFSKAEQTADIQ